MSIFVSSSVQAYDVFSGKTLSGLTDHTIFTVSINPSGVVMWYVYPVKQSPRPPKDTGRYPYLRKKYRMS